MHCLIIEKKDGMYSFKKFSDTSMKTLAWFLLYDATTTDIKLIREWLSNQQRNTKTGNTSSLEKFEDLIFIASEVSEKDDEFEISVNGFIDLINRWELLLQQKPKKIIITKEGDKVTIEGRD